MVVPPQFAKAELRLLLKKQRQDIYKSYDSVGMASLLAALAETVSSRLSEARTVAAYVAIGTEIDPAPVVERLHVAGVAIALPRIEAGQSAMRFLRWKPGDALDEGPHGLKQPPASATECEPDVILTPLLGFDDALNRIGYGAGYYDRAFERFPNARRIGLAWAGQRCDVIPTDPWDIPLHAIATEQGWIER